MKFKDFDTFIMSLSGVICRDDTSSKEYVFYKYGQDEDSKIAAIVIKGSNPLIISLKCDPKLAKVLRERYESVMPENNMNKRNWNKIICSGQLEIFEIEDLIKMSVKLVSKGVNEA